MKKTVYFIVLTAIVHILSACSGSTVYDEYAHTPIAGWEKNDTLSFAIPPLKDAAMYSAVLGVRTTDAYPFTAITLIVEQEIMPAHRLVTDTVCCNLTDEQGNILGEGISYRQYQFDICKLQLQEGDSLHIVVRHDMKREILPGVADVGIQLKKE